ncbi:MAG: hypothetical protein ACLFRE_03800 [Desulfovermiculus sp.]
MSTRSGQDNHQDQEIIELTEVVEEPDDPSAAVPSVPEKHNDKSNSQNGHTKAFIRPQGQEKTSEPDDEDDFDFSSLVYEAESSDPSSKPKDEFSLQKSRSPQAHFAEQENDDLEDLFDELDLDLDPDQDSYWESRAGRGGKTKTEKQIQVLNQRLEDLESRSLDQASLQALESRIAQLENGTFSQNRESWKEVENRILNRLEDMVQEQITKARNALHQEMETASQDNYPAWEKEVRELAKKVEEINSYALGPETLSALKNELWTELSQRIEETVPLAAAQIVRQEIQALLDEDQDLERNSSEE